MQARLQAIPIAEPWTRERAEHWWSQHVPEVTSKRSVADLVLSQEARPLRVIHPTQK